MRRRFRWTRERYRKAESLSRYFSRHVYDLPSEPPELLRLLWELWAQHPQHNDPLLMPFKWRLRTFYPDDEIPF